MRSFLFSLLLLCTGILRGQELYLTADDYGFAATELRVTAKLPYPLESVKTVQLETPLYPGVEYRIFFWLGGQKYPNSSYSYDVDLVLSDMMFVEQENDFQEVDHLGRMPRLVVNEFTSEFERNLIEYIVRPDRVYTYISVGMRNRDADTRINIREAADVGPIFVELIGIGPVEEERAGYPVYEVEIQEDKPPPTEFSDPIIASPPENSDKDTSPNDRPPVPRELIDKGTVYCVDQRELEIGLYDHKNIDGDIVTIYLNEQIVVENLTLAKKKAYFTLDLLPGMNTLRLHAENLGTYAPNTAAIQIKTKGKNILEVLNSDMEKSEYFTLDYLPK